MASRVKIYQTNDGGTEYLFGPMRVYLYNDYLVWSQGVMGIENTQIRYSDIISVSYSNGGMFANAWFQINTAGRLYNCGFTCAASGLELLEQDILERKAAVTQADEEALKKLLGQISSSDKKVPISENEVPHESQNVPRHNVNINPNDIEPTIIRIQLFLEDSEWEQAETYISNALDYFPTDYRLYLLQICAELKITKPEHLGSKHDAVINNNLYKKVLRFANDEDRERICDIIDEYENDYQKALDCIQNKEYLEAVSLLKSLDSYKDSKRLVKKYEKLACSEEAYAAAMSLVEHAKGEDDYIKALDLLRSIGDYKDAAQKISEISDKAFENLYAKVANSIDTAESDEDYDCLINNLMRMDGYKDSHELLKIVRKRSGRLAKEDKYDELMAAYQRMGNMSINELHELQTAFSKLGDYENSKSIANKIRKKVNNRSNKLIRKTIEAIKNTYDLEIYQKANDAIEDAGCSDRIKQLKALMVELVDKLKDWQESNNELEQALSKISVFKISERSHVKKKAQELNLSFDEERRRIIESMEYLLGKRDG